MLVPDSDSVFRHCVYPNPFKKRAFVPGKFLRLDNMPYGFIGSVAWERFLPTHDYVHGYGCRLALGMNRRDEARGRFKEEDKKIYCGAYRLSARAIRSLPRTQGLVGIQTIDVEHHIEHGEIAHCDLIVVLKSNRDARTYAQEGTKTAAIAGFWTLCFGPLPHICTCDSGVKPHPSENLPTPPSGNCVDATISIWRYWYIVRLQVCSLLWR